MENYSEPLAVATRRDDTSPALQRRVEFGITKVPTGRPNSHHLRPEFGNGPGRPVGTRAGAGTDTVLKRRAIIMASLCDSEAEIIWRPRLKS